MRKTNRGTFTNEQMERAVKLVRENNYKLRRAAEECNLNYVTLYRYVKKHKVAEDEGTAEQIRFTPKYQSRLVFTRDQEKALAEYLLICSKMCYGKSSRDTRELAYEMATLNGITVPASWHKNSAAGLDWLSGFLKRNPNLSRRQPEKCSLSRCTSFNPHTVNTFYNNLEAALQRSESFADGSRTWNLDETATSTVVNKSVKIIAEKGCRGVATVAAGEKGTLVTTCCFVSATGNTIPPALVFPRVKFRDHMLINGPPGALGLATKSGWMTAEIFPQVIKHFIKHTVTSKDNPTLLVMDNHHSHICIEVINLARDNGITIVTLPPHCSGKLQPLDVSCYHPFKAYYAAAVDSWQKQNPGKVFSIYNIAGCVNEAHQKAMTPSTIINGFRKTGIFPYDRHLFTEADFLSSSVTDRPNPELRTTEDAGTSAPPIPSTSSEQPPIPMNHPTPSSNPSSKNETEDNLDKNASKSPAIFKGYPKAGPRSASTRKRKSGRSMIATDTPEKNLIEAALATATKKPKPHSKKQAATKQLFSKASSDHEDTDEDGGNVLEEWSDTSSEQVSWTSGLNEDNFDDIDTVVDSVQENQFVLVEFLDKKKKFYYVGKILKEKDNAGEVEVLFLRKSSKVVNAFYYPEKEDIASVDIKDIKLILSSPATRKGTKRLQSFLVFEVRFANLDIR